MSYLPPPTPDDERRLAAFDKAARRLKRALRWHQLRQRVARLLRGRP